MKDLSTFTLQHQELITEQFPNTYLKVRRRRRSYERFGDVIFTSSRIVCLSHSNLGGIKEVFDCSYFDIEAVRTQSDFNVYGGLAIYSRDGESFHAGFLRSHLRAMQVFMLLLFNAGLEYDTRDNIIRRLSRCTFDFRVPDDYLDLFVDKEHFSKLAECYGLVIQSNCQPYFADPSSFPLTGQQSKNAGNASQPQPDIGIKTLDLHELRTQRFSYLISKQCLSDGEYVVKGEQIMLIQLSSKKIPVIITSPSKGFVHWLYKSGDEWYSASETVVQVLDTPKSAQAIKNKDVDVATIAEGVDQYLSELDNLTGLKQVKTEVRQLVSLIQIQQERERLGISSQPMNQHMVFLGSPGTGKTTVARILGGLFKELGLLSKGHFVEVDRSGLVAGYLGQTAIKTLDVLKSCLGGVLFVDEAYSLTSSGSLSAESDQFGDEAIDTLLKFMEDHRDNFIVIAAGYTNEMNRFLASNPGLKSRFNTFIVFDDYSENELLEILFKSAKSFNYRIDTEAVASISEILSRLCRSRGSNFGNARSMRNLLELAIKRQAHRLASKPFRSKDDLQLLIKEDFLIEDERLSDI
jgi:Holliday junction resolvasome RuvABC ATP-dependent DNA helicase subunit